MNIEIFFPVFAHLALTLTLLGFLAVMSRNALVSKQVSMRDIAVERSGWPIHIRQVSNSYSSQFEIPVIFYVLCFMAYITKMADIYLIALAWIFVATRFAHAWVHTHSNHVRIRGMFFAAGSLTIMVMTIMLLVKLITHSI